MNFLFVNNILIISSYISPTFGLRSLPQWGEKASQTCYKTVLYRVFLLVHRYYPHIFDNTWAREGVVNCIITPYSHGKNFLLFYIINTEISYECLLRQNDSGCNLPEIVWSSI